jgi:hypothetical protein
MPPMPVRAPTTSVFELDLFISTTSPFHAPLPLLSVCPRSLPPVCLLYTTLAAPITHDLARGWGIYDCMTDLTPTAGRSRRSAWPAAPRPGSAAQAQRRASCPGRPCRPAASPRRASKRPAQGRAARRCQYVGAGRGQKESRGRSHKVAKGNAEPEGGLSVDRFESDELARGVGVVTRVSGKRLPHVVAHR